jgi:hypothetical protein
MRNPFKKKTYPCCWHCRQGYYAPRSCLTAGASAPNLDFDNTKGHYSDCPECVKGPRLPLSYDPLQGAFSG